MGLPINFYSHFAHPKPCWDTVVLGGDLGHTDGRYGYFDLTLSVTNTQYCTIEVDRAINLSFLNVDALLCCLTLTDSKA